MTFGILVDGVIVEAPQSYTSEKGKYITNFPRYLELMYTNSFFSRMYGYKPIEELTKVTNEEKIRKLESELEVTQMALDEILMNMAII